MYTSNIKITVEINSTNKIFDSAVHFFITISSEVQRGKTMSFSTLLI